MFDPTVEATIKSIEEELTSLAKQAELAVKNGVVACDQARLEDIKGQIANWKAE